MARAASAPRPGTLPNARYGFATRFENEPGTRRVGLLFSMDDMVGKDFDKGLASLKAAARKIVPGVSCIHG